MVHTLRQITASHVGIDHSDGILSVQLNARVGSGYGNRRSRRRLCSNGQKFDNIADPGDSRSLVKSWPGVMTPIPTSKNTMMKLSHRTKDNSPAKWTVSSALGLNDVSSSGTIRDWLK